MNMTTSNNTFRFTQVGGGFGDPVAYGGMFTDSRGLWAAPYGFGDYSDHVFGSNEDGLQVMPVYFADLDFTFDDNTWIDCDAVSDFIGCDVTTLDAPDQIEAVASYYGWDNFDSCPLLFTEAEMTEFWAQVSTV